MNSFSSWYSWTNRKDLPGSDMPGVYLIAEFDHPPVEGVSPLDRHILQIGRTGADSKQTGGAYDDFLSKRLGKFEHSATTGKKAHSGARTLSKKSLPERWEDVYVAALQFPFPSDEDVRVALSTVGLGDLDTKAAKRVLVSNRYGTWFREVERKLLEDFESKHGHLPPGNKVL